MKKSRIPKPGSPFNAEVFIKLLVDRKNRLTTEKENEFIDKELIRNEEAYNWFLDVQATYPGEDLMPDLTTPTYIPSHAPKWRKVAVIAVLAVITVGGCSYAISRLLGDTSEKEKTTSDMHTAPVQQEQQQQQLPQGNFYKLDQQPLSQIADTIRKYYRIEVFFDRPELAFDRFSGGFDTRLPLNELLENLLVGKDIKYEFDDKKNLHFK